MPKSPGEMMQAIQANLPKRTGKTLEEWVAVLRTCPLEGFRERQNWLRTEHGLGSSTAFLIVEPERGSRYDDPEKLVDELYSGPRAALRPIHDALIEAVKKLGKDVRIGARSGYVPISRRVQFAVIKPTTQTRIDLGLRLGDIPAEGRLLPARNLGGGDKIRHRIELSSKKDIDAEVKAWLKRAYQQNG